jgi:DNA polymerase-1
MNAPIQGTAADIIKIAMIRVYDRLKQEGLQAQLILQVHDELMVEAPEAEADRVAQILKQEMEGAAQLAVKLEVDVGIGKTWGEAH